MDTNSLVKTLASTIKNEIRQVVPMLMVMLYFYIFDTGSFSVVSYMLGIMLAVAMFTHAVRRLLFRGLKVESFYGKALESPMASAIVFAGVCFIYGMMFLAVSSMFK